MTTMTKKTRPINNKTLEKIFSNHGWMDEHDLPDLEKDFGGLIIYVRLINGGGFKCYLRDARNYIALHRKRGQDYDEMGFNCPMFYFLCAMFGVDCRYSTDLELEMVN